MNRYRKVEATVNGPCGESCCRTHQGVQLVVDTAQGETRVLASSNSTEERDGAEEAIDRLLMLSRRPMGRVLLDAIVDTPMLRDYTGNLLEVIIEAMEPVVIDGEATAEVRGLVLIAA